MSSIFTFFFLGPFHKANRITFVQWVCVWIMTLFAAYVGYAFGSFIYKMFACANHAMDSYLGK